MKFRTKVNILRLFEKNNVKWSLFGALCILFIFVMVSPFIFKSWKISAVLILLVSLFNAVLFWLYSGFIRRLKDSIADMTDEEPEKRKEKVNI